MIAGQYNNIFKNKGYNYPYTATRRFITNADLAIANLECPVSTRGKKNRKKLFTYRARPESLKGLKWAGFDLCNIANNHSMDFGRDAFFDTIKNIKKQGMLYSGGGKNIEEATKPAFVTVKSQKIHVVGYHLVLYKSTSHATKTRPGVGTAHEGNIKKRLSKWANNCDILIVLFHWGSEYTHVPLQYQRNNARLCIDMGADIVIGNHPHVWQPVEIYKGKPIIYSLGNYVFGSYGRKMNNLKAEESFLLTINFIKDKLHHLKLIPIDVDNKRVNFVPKPMSPEKGKEMLLRIKKASTNVKGSFYITPEGHGIILPGAEYQ